MSTISSTSSSQSGLSISVSPNPSTLTKTPSTTGWMDRFSKAADYVYEKRISIGFGTGGGALGAIVSPALASIPGYKEGLGAMGFVVTVLASTSACAAVGTFIGKCIEGSRQVNDLPDDHRSTDIDKTGEVSVDMHVIDDETSNDGDVDMNVQEEISNNDESNIV